MSGNSVIPKNELERNIRLSEFDLDYLDLEDNFKDLTSLAAQLANTEISLVNLIDTYTQWSVSSHNFDLKQMSRNQTVCQYTIMRSHWRSKIFPKMIASTVNYMSKKDRN